MSLFFNAVLLFVAFIVSGQTFSRIWGTYPTHACHSIQEECSVYTWENFKLDELKIFYPCGLFLFACLFGKHWLYGCLGSLAYQSNFSSTIFLTPRSDTYYSLVEIKKKKKQKKLLLRRTPTK